MNALELALRNAEIFNDEWDCAAGAGDFAIVPMETGAIEILEGVCHELAHAVTLGVALGKRLAARVGDAVRERRAWRDGRVCDENEVHAHAIVMGVFARIGIDFDRDDFACAAAHQTDIRRREVVKLWRSYQRTNDYRGAVAEVLSELLFEVDQARPRTP